MSDDLFPLFRQYLSYLKRRHNDGEAPAQNTIDTRRRELEAFTEWLRAEGVDSAEAVREYHVTDYIEYLVAEGYALSTVTKAKYGTVSAAFTRLYDERDIEQNPVDTLSRKTAESIYNRNTDSEALRDTHDSESVDYLTKEEVYDLAKAVPTPKTRNELLVKLMFWTGIRKGEVVKIQIGEDGSIDGSGSDFNLDGPTIRIEQEKRKADDPFRWVSYPPTEIHPLLRDYVRNGRLRYKATDDTQRLFVGRKGPLKKRGVQRVIREAAKNLGIGDDSQEAVDGREYHRVTPHILRHSHAMHQHNERGVSLDTLSDHLGHVSVETTEEYYATSTVDKITDTFSQQ